VSSVGYTALLVAALRALPAASAEPLVRDEYAKHFITASADPYLTGLLSDPEISECPSVFARLYGLQTRFSTTSSYPPLTTACLAVVTASAGY
jgi:O-methyltransferase involved in polyketide biosynthesis